MNYRILLVAVLINPAATILCKEPETRTRKPNQQPLKEAASATRSQNKHESLLQALLASQVARLQQTHGGYENRVNTIEDVLRSIQQAQETAENIAGKTIDYAYVGAIALAAAAGGIAGFALAVAMGGPVH